MNQFQNLLYRAGSERVLPGRPGGSLGITPLNKAWENRKEAVKEWQRRDMQRPIPKPYHPRDNPHYIPGTGNWSFINQPSYRLAGNPSFDINPAANKRAQRRKKIENLGKGSTNLGEQEAAKEALKRLGGGINLPLV